MKCEAGLTPSRSPAALLFFIYFMVFRQSEQPSLEIREGCSFYAAGPSPGSPGSARTPPAVPGAQSLSRYHDYPFKACIDFVRQLHSILLSPEVRAHGRCRSFAPSRLHQSIICPPLSLRSRQGRRGGRPLYPGLRLFSGARSCICGSDWV